jgi:hypothetical protein
MAISISGSSSQSLNAAANSSTVTAGGTMVLTVGNWFGLQSWGRVNIGGQGYSIAGPTSMSQGGSWSWDASRLYGHNSNTGTRGAVESSVSHDIDGTTLHRGSAGAGTQGALDYDRTPTTPSFSSGSRTVTGGSFSTTSWSGGVNNSGPAVTWTLQRSTVSNFSSGVANIQSTTTSNATLTSGSLDPNTTYYYRIRASNADTSNTNSHPNPKFSSIITSFGVPGPPTNLTVTPSTTDAGKVNLSWTAPGNTQGGISRYDIFVNDTFVQSTTSTSLTSIKSTSGNAALVPGTSYNFRVASKNSTNLNETAVANLSSSITSNIQRRSPAPPTAPTYGSNPNPPAKVGRNVTILIANDADSINTNTPILNYYVQYQTSLTETGTYGSWSTPQQMSLSGSNYTYTYVLLQPALWYKFRVYAKNSIINTVSPSTGTVTRSYYPDDDSAYTANFSVPTTTLFVPAAGKRYDSASNTFVITNVAKRYNAITNSWVDVANAKRYNAVQEQWEDLT